MSLFPRMASSTDLAIMVEAHERFCFQQGIEDGIVRSDIALLVLLLFESGAKTVEELTYELNRLRAF